MNLLSKYFAHTQFSDPRHMNIRDIVTNWAKLTLMNQGISSELGDFNHNTHNPEQVLKEIHDWLRDKNMVCIGSELNRTAMYIIPSEDKSDIAGWIEIDNSTTSVNFRCRAKPDTVADLVGYLKDRYNNTGAIIRTLTGFSSSGHITYRSDYVNPSDTDLALDCFYPWMTQSIAEFNAAYKASDENVLVIYGPPGTGKSTFLRTMIAMQTETAWLAYTKEMLESPKPVTEFFSHLKTRYMIMEDVDRYLGARADGNDMMSMYLNATEGIVRVPNKKVIFSTNLPSIDRIDEALLRRGRCYDVLKFRLLTPDEKIVIEDKMGMEHRAPNNKDAYSLAEILRPAKQAVKNDRLPRNAGFA